MTFRYTWVRTVALVYCTLPVMLFLGLWTKKTVGIPCLLALAVALGLGALTLSNQHAEKDVFPSPFERCVAALRDRGEERTCTISRGWVVTMIIVCLVWCFLGGQGGMWYQSSDWDSRNALFRDLITHGWPVRYQSDGGWLCYYVGHWLPAALAGKALLHLGLSLDVVWRIANIGLLLWTTLGVFLTMLLIALTTQPQTGFQRAICLFVPIMFATPDVLGMIVSGAREAQLQSLHLEWWAENMQYSSLTTCLFWVFNQTVATWVATLLFVNERSPSRYLPIWLGCLFAGPLPAIGLALLMLAQGVAELCRAEKGVAYLLKSVFSAENLLVLPTIAVVALYFLSSSAVGEELNAAWAANNLLPTPLYLPGGRHALVLVALFVAIEALLVPCLLRLIGEKGTLLTSAVLIMLICPFIRFNSTADFCMRVSVPSVMVLCVLSVQALLALVERSVSPIRYLPGTLLVLVLACGAMTPAMEFYRGFHTVSQQGIAASVNDPYVTFEGRDGWPRTNFVVQDNGDDGPFFKLVAEEWATAQ